MLSATAYERILTAALSTGASYAEVFAEDTRKNTIQLNGRKAASPMTGRDYGASIRVFFGTDSFYAYTSDVTEDGLLELAAKVAALGNGSGRLRPSLPGEAKPAAKTNPIGIYPTAIISAEKVDILRAITDAALAYDARIKTANINYIDLDQDFIIANSDGVFARDRRVYTRLRVNAMAESSARTRVGNVNRDLQMGLERFEQETPRQIGEKAAASAITLLNARPCPTGEMTVVLGEDGGTFVHEACGHALEACRVADGGSIFSGKLGQQVASAKVSVWDDGTIPSAFGSIDIDDEGIRPTRNLLIENGILRNYMVDRLGSLKLGLPPTGCCRKESYRFCPTSRMTNTYIQPGQDTREDIIGSVRHGLYVKSVGGGTAHVNTGGFDFVVDEAYVVEDGRITYPVSGATLSGNTLEVLHNIEMVGRQSGERGPVDLGGSVCGAASGNVPVTSTIPMLKIRKLSIGGR